MDELGDYEALRIRHQRIAEPATMLSTEGPRLVQLLVFRDVGRLVRVDISGEMQLITEAPNLIAGLVDPVESYRLK